MNRLIPFYGIGVFTSFTMSQGGMARHHFNKRERGWQLGLLVNGLGCLMTLTVTLIFLVKFGRQGAWVILILVPLLVIALVRMNRQYVDEESELEEEVAELAGRRILPKPPCWSWSTRSTGPPPVPCSTGAASTRRDPGGALRDRRAEGEALADEWTTLGLGRIPLQIVECPDRRVANAALKVAAGEARMGDREVTVLLPRLEYRRAWHRILHDRTGSEIAQAVDVLPRVNVTFVPYHLQAGRHAKDLSVADVIEHHTTAPVPVVSLGAPAKPTPGVDPDVDLDQNLAELSGRPEAAPEGGIGSARFRERVELVGARAVTARATVVRRRDARDHAGRRHGVDQRRVPGSAHDRRHLGWHPTGRDRRRGIAPGAPGDAQPPLSNHRLTSPTEGGGASARSAS